VDAVSLGLRAMSRIDRFLLSEEWCLQWPNCFQVALLRGLSDHCPLQLSVDEENWGPRPSRMLKCWQDMPGYKQFVQDKWNSFHVEGWGGFVIKEKLKFLKTELKEWHSIHIPGRINSLKARLSDFDEKNAVGGLSVEEREELKGITHDIHYLSRVNTSITWQQSRLLWLKADGANSKYFHSAFSSRRRRNSIVSLMVNGSLVEGVQPIRHAVFTHFKNHFEDANRSRLGVANLAFKSLSVVEGTGLIIPFSEEEVKSAIWDCDNYKSPGPDGVNFGFLKDCWEIVKGDVLRFITDFH
jgi:hypothetical protein